MKKDKDTKTEENKVKEPGFKNLVPYFGLLRPHWLPFLGALLCGIVYGLASGFGLPTMIDQIFPKIFPTQANPEPALRTAQLFLYVSVFPLVFLIRGVSGYFNTYLINYCGVRVLEQVRIKVFRKLQRLPLAFYHENKEGDLLSRVTNDTGQLQTAILTISNDLIRQPVTFLGAISALIYMAIQREGMAFVLLCLVVIPICIFPIRRIGEILMKKALGMQERAGGLTAVLSENLSAPREIRAFNLEERENERFRKSSEKFFLARMKVIKYSNLLTPIIEIITAAGIAWAIFQASRMSIHLDAVIPVIIALYLSYEPIKKLGGIQNQYKQGLASLQRLDEVLDAEESIRNPEHPVELAKIKGELRFEKVSFSYKNGGGESEEASPPSPALHQVELKIRAGEVVALVGPSGAGKTTLAGMLSRFHDPSEGAILLDGVDLRSLALKDLRDAVALVPQKPFLFDVTVRENIEMGKSPYTDSTVEEVAEASHATVFIEDFPDRFDERLGENGNRLSGGQLQRLALARAFYKNSPLLVLDEATSALDSENEEKIHEAMAELSKGKTTLLIAHRFSSIRLATRIIVLDKGKVVAEGPHDEVYEKCELYRNLYDRQREASP
jgi:subfamily B ATP-binding cassette protein MsbA